MINRRQLDDLISGSQCRSERQCAYREDYLTWEEFEEGIEPPEDEMRERVEHVDSWSALKLEMRLADYLFEKCYYDDIDEVKANVDYVNKKVRQDNQFLGWKDIQLDTILARINEKKEEQEKKRAKYSIEADPSVEEDLSIFDLTFENDDDETPTSEEHLDSLE